MENQAPLVLIKLLQEGMTMRQAKEKLGLPVDKTKPDKPKAEKAEE